MPVGERRANGLSREDPFDMHVIGLREEPDDPKLETRGLDPQLACYEVTGFINAHS